VDVPEWKRELKLHDELLELIGDRLPKELAARRAQLSARSLRAAWSEACVEKRWSSGEQAVQTLWVACGCST